MPRMQDTTPNAGSMFLLIQLCRCVCGSVKYRSNGGMSFNCDNCNRAYPRDRHFAEDTAKLAQVAWNYDPVPEAATNSCPPFPLPLGILKTPRSICERGSFFWFQAFDPNESQLAILAKLLS